MSRPVTLASLVRRSLERADLPLTTERVDQSAGGEVETLVQEAAAELYEHVVQSFGAEYFYTESTIAVTSGVRYSDLPDNHYKTIHVWWIGMRTVGPDAPMLLDVFPEEEDFKNWTNPRWTEGDPPRYRERGQLLFYDIVPDQNYELLMQYVPVMPAIEDLVPPLTPVPFEGIHGWEQWIITYVAKCLLEKDRVDASHLTQELSRLTARIEKFAPRRNIHKKQRVRRTNGRKWRGLTVPRFRTS